MLFINEISDADKINKINVQVIIIKEISILYIIMKITSQFQVVEETFFFSKQTMALPQVTGNFHTCPGRDLNQGSGQRQLAVSGSTLDHRAWSLKCRPLTILCS